MNRYMGFPSMLYAVSIIHLTWAFSLIYKPSIVSQLAVLGGINTWIDIGIPIWLVASFLICFSILAIYTLLTENKLTRRWILIGLAPQYIIVLVALTSEIILIIDTHYKGRSIDRITIIDALISLVVISLFHTYAIIERYFIKWKLLFSRPL